MPRHHHDPDSPPRRVLCTLPVEKETCQRIPAISHALAVASPHGGLFPYKPAPLVRAGWGTPQEKTMCQPAQTISLNKHYEVRHWTREFRCTETELFEAVRAVGLDAAKVLSFRSAMPKSTFVANPAAAYR